MNDELTDLERLDQELELWLYWSKRVRKATRIAGAATIVTAAFLAGRWTR